MRTGDHQTQDHLFQPMTIHNRVLASSAPQSEHDVDLYIKVIEIALRAEGRATLKIAASGMAEMTSSRVSVL